MGKHGSITPFWYTDQRIVAAYKRKAKIRRDMQKASRKRNRKSYNKR